jgi:hypothetical protein
MEGIQEKKFEAGFEELDKEDIQELNSHKEKLSNKKVVINMKTEKKRMKMLNLMMTLQ